MHLAADTSKRAELAGTFDFLVAGVIDTYADSLCEAIPTDVADLPELLTRIVGGAVHELTELR